MPTQFTPQSLIIELKIITRRFVVHFVKFSSKIKNYFKKNLNIFK